MTDEWFVWHRQWLRYKVATCVTSWALGSGYKYARSKNGFVLRFWSKLAAQAYADKLNKWSIVDLLGSFRP